MQAGNRFKQNGLAGAGGTEDDRVCPFSHCKVDLEQIEIRHFYLHVF
jgi:hypothetical protein